MRAQLPKDLRRVNRISLSAADTYLARLRGVDYDVFDPSLQKTPEAEALKIRIKLRAQDAFSFK
jgi:hypothetical protein